MPSNRIPEELRLLASYLQKDAISRSLEMLCSGAWVLDPNEKLSVVKLALKSATDGARKELESYLDEVSIDPDDDNGVFMSMVCEDDVAAAINRAAPDLSDKILNRLSRFGEDRELPSWHFLDFTKLHNDGWLVHCTGDGASVMEDGFLFGVDDVTKLGLTVHLSDYEKSRHGFNFAYAAAAFERYAYKSGVCRYGGDVILLRAPYVEAWHYTDEEPQAIFWGPSARDIFVLNEASRGHYILELEDDGDGPGEIFAESIPGLIQEIERNREHVACKENPVLTRSTSASIKKIKKRLI